MGVKVTSKGSFRNTEAMLKSLKKMDLAKILDGYGRVGANALASATPVDSGLTAQLWDYEVEDFPWGCVITWINTNVTPGGPPVAILLQFGHGTGTGGYVSGYDYINPAIRPIFDKIEADVWKAVTSA